jgi:hypothetical protein
MDRDVEAVLSLEVNRDISRPVDKEVSAIINVTEGVSADDNRLAPVFDESGDILYDDGLSEDSAVEIVPDRAVGALPHLLELELFDSGLVRSDGGALDADLALFDGLGGVEGDLVVGLISILDAQVEVLDVKIKEWMDELVLDVLPEDSGHLVTVELGHGVVDLYFLGGKPEGQRRSSSGRYALG